MSGTHCRVTSGFVRERVDGVMVVGPLATMVPYQAALQRRPCCPAFVIWFKLLRAQGSNSLAPGAAALRLAPREAVVPAARVTTVAQSLGA